MKPTPLLIILTLLAITPLAHAQTRTWIALDGAWDNPANWSDGIIPQPLDAVIITADQDITIQGPTLPTQIETLSVGGLNNVNFTLNPTGPLKITTSFFLGNSATLTGSGAIDALGYNTLPQSTIAPTGDLTFLKPVIPEGDSTILQPININGSLNVSSHTVTFENGAIINGAVNIDGGLLTHPLDNPLTRFTFNFTPETPGDSQINGHGQILSNVTLHSLNATGDFTLGNTTNPTYQLRFGDINTNNNTVTIQANEGTHEINATLEPGGHLIVPDVMRQGSLTFNGGTLTTNILDNLFINQWQEGTLQVNGRFGLQIGPASRQDFKLASTTDLFINPNMAIQVANHFSVIGGNSIATSYAVHLHGGSISAETVGFQGFSSLDWQTGTFHITGPAGLNIGASDFPFQHLAINNNMSLIVDNTLHIAQAGTLQYNGGTIAADIISIQDGGLFDLATPFTNNDTLSFQTSSSRLRGQTLTNQGLITGAGRILANLNNNASAELRVPSGAAMYLGGTQNTNAGKIELAGGNSFLISEIEFANTLTNAPNTGLIVTSGNSILRFNGGLQNQGAIGIAFADTQLHGDINNTGIITINGASKALFNDDLHNNGSLYISSDSTAVFFGTLDGANGTSGAGDVQIFGDLRPGNSPAAISFGGDLELSPRAALHIEITGPQPATQHDQINIAGAFHKAGALNILFDENFTLIPGLNLNLINFDSTSGAFTSTPNFINLNNPNNIALFLDEQPNAINLITAIPGDFNFDGQVDVADLSTWATGFGQTNTTFPFGDADQNGQVDVADLSIWATTFAKTNAHYTSPLPLTTGASATAIPEPSSLILLGALSIPTLLRRRKP